MIPHFFTKAPIPILTNPDLIEAVELVKHQKNIVCAIEKAYHLVGCRFISYRFRTFVYFWKAFEDDPNVLWSRRGFMHCHHQNFLLRVLLVKSGWVADEQIQLRYSPVWYVSPHQYLRVTVGGRVIALDPWNESYGAKVGEFAYGFGKRRLDEPVV